MGKASSSKKVGRVARTGGGRTTRGSSTSWFWPVFVVVVVVLGTAGIAYSKDQTAPDTSRPRAAGNGKAGDHWHAAIGFDICGTFAPNITTQAETSGVHSHDDGLVHMEPTSAIDSGKRVTLGLFFQTVKAKVTDSEIQLPGGPTKKNGQKCGDKPAQVQIKTWADRKPDTSGSIFNGKPSDIHPKNGELITVAFVPKGDDIPRPPSADQLDKVSGVGTQPSTTVPTAAPPTTGAPPSNPTSSSVP